MKKGGSKPGERRGGRKPGSKNKLTLERERIANEEALKRQELALTNPEKPLAKDVLENIMFATLTLANHYKPAAPGEPAKPHADINICFRALELSIGAGKAAASFQSPTFKSVDFRPQLPVMPEPKRNGDDAKVIDIKDPKIQSQIYMRLIKHKASK